MNNTRGFASGDDNIAVDIGNTYSKAVMIRNGRQEAECYFPTAIVEVTERKYDELVYGYGSDSGQYQFLKWNGRYFIVGEDAYNAGDFRPLEGRQKYTKDYYGILLASAILRLYCGEPPETLNVFAGFPAGDVSQLPTLLKCIVGSWALDNLGKRIKFRVAFASGYPEIIGGAMNIVLAPDGLRYADHPIIEDGPTVVCDLGGGTFDIVGLKQDGTPDYTRMASRRIGINDAIENFRSLFDKRFPEAVEDTENGLPDSRIHECFLDEKHRVRTPAGYLDCWDIYEQATSNLLNQVRIAYREMVRGSVSFNHALMTGGGGGLLLQELAERVFMQFADGGALHASDKRDEMFIASPRGAGKMLVAMSYMTPSKRRVR